MFRHLADRNGVRATARLVGVAPNTVVRYCRLAGGHARALHDEFVELSPRTTEIQFDEKWSFVFKNQTHCDPDDPADADRGDWWDHVAYDPEHRLVLCVVPGARDVECVEEIVHETRRRTGGRVLRLDDQRRLLGLRDGDPGRLWAGPDDHAERSGEPADDRRRRSRRRG